MPAPYTIKNIILEQGIGKNEDGTYRAFLDNPVSIKYTGNFVESKWFFQAPNSTTGEFETLILKESFVPNPPNTDANTQLTLGKTTLEFTKFLNKIKLEDLFGNNQIGDIKITVIPGSEGGGGIDWRQDDAESVVINFQTP